MATEHAAAAIETSHRNGMIKRLSVISMSFLERILKTAGPYDHDQWPHEPTVGPINPGMLTKIAKESSTEYLNIMTNSGRDALAEFDGRLLRQVLKNVIFETLSVSRKSRRATSPSNQHMSPSNQTDNNNNNNSPGLTPRDYNHRSPAGVSQLPLGNLSPYGNHHGGQQMSTGRSIMSTTSTTSLLGANRFMALHPAKAEAMIAVKRMLDPLMQTSKFPREAYKAVVMDVGDQFMERFHPNEQFHHVSRTENSNNNNNNNNDDNNSNSYNNNNSATDSSSHALQNTEREWITATVLAAISRIAVNEDGSVTVNGRIVAYALPGSQMHAHAAGLSSSSSASRGVSQSSPYGRTGSADGSFLKQLQRLRNILAQEDQNDQSTASISSNSNSNNNNAAIPSLSVDGRGASSPSPSVYRSPTLNNDQQAAPVDKSYRERVYCILAKYAPNRIDRVEKYMDQYKGHEEELIQALVEKYGPEPIGDAPVEVDVPPVSNNSNNQRDTSASPSSAAAKKSAEIERQIAMMQQQMNQMQSQLAAAQQELKVVRASEERDDETQGTADNTEQQASAEPTAAAAAETTE